MSTSARAVRMALLVTGSWCALVPFTLYWSTEIRLPGVPGRVFVWAGCVQLEVWHPRVDKTISRLCQNALLERRNGDIRWLPGFTAAYRPPFVAIVRLPIWLIIVLAATSVMLVQRIRRCGAPLGWVCRSCGYDLTGNVSGVCPECGSRIVIQRPRAGPPGGGPEC